MRHADTCPANRHDRSRDAECQCGALSCRLAHFENNQIKAGDGYGAEVLYRARTELEAVTSALERLDLSVRDCIESGDFDDLQHNLPFGEVREILDSRAALERLDGKLQEADVPVDEVKDG